MTILKVNSPFKEVSFIYFFLLIKNLILHAELPKPPMFLLPVGGRGGPLPLPLPLPPEPPGL